MDKFDLTDKLKEELKKRNLWEQEEEDDDQDDDQENESSNHNEDFCEMVVNCYTHKHKFIFSI